MTEIKNLRQGLRLSQEEFGFILGVSSRTIRSWENESRTPSRLALRSFESLHRRHPKMKMNIENDRPQP